MINNKARKFMIELIKRNHHSREYNRSLEENGFISAVALGILDDFKLQGI
jgi:hypothetical protein